MDLNELLIELKKNKSIYYISNFIRRIIPDEFYNRRLESQLSRISKFDENEVFERVNYYNKLDSHLWIDGNAVELNNVKKLKASSAYIFDTQEYTRYFPQSLRANFVFGDVIHIPNTPSIQKSRPIFGNNKNAILLNLDKKRHFFFINDPVKFKEKKDVLIGRASVTQPHRIEFMSKHFNTPLADIGQVNKVGGDPMWIKPKMSIFQHLQYKFILSLEGNDVATNLKWIMSSRSVAVMPVPKYETWFMEGKLIPNFHYICIKDDYSDLVDVLEYFIEHPREAEQISFNANQYVNKFRNKEKEDIIALLVLKKYFEYTSQ